jgi:hypothetical protein
MLARQACASSNQTATKLFFEGVDECQDIAWRAALGMLKCFYTKLSSSIE